MNRISKHIAISSIIVAGVCTGALFLGGCGSSEMKTADEQVPKEMAPSVQVFPLKKARMASSIQVPGELIAYQQVDLYAKVSSFVKKLYADVGSEVRAGQLLASMDAPEISSQLAAAGSKLKSLEAVNLASKANYDRLYETSQTPGTVSQNDIDQALAKKNAAQADLEAAQSALREIADNKNYLEIRAPFAGVITARNVHTGAYVGPSGKGSELPLFTLQEQKRLRLVISVPEAFTGYIKNKEKTGFSVKAMPEKKFTASINRMAGALDTRLRSERIEMDVSNNDKKLLPGMIAEVNISLPGTDSSFVVPRTAFVNSTEKQFVIRIRNHKAEWVEVKKGREEASRVEIYGNLAAGDQLVRMASEEIRNGSTQETVTAVEE